MAETGNPRGFPVSIMAKRVGDGYHGPVRILTFAIRPEQPTTLSPIRRKRRPAKRKSTSRRKGAGRRLRLLLIAAIVVVIGGVGLLKWAESRRGQAALLSLGAPRVYGDVQETVEAALPTVLPELPPGPAAVVGAEGAASGRDCDWPDRDLGPGAAIRCRSVPVDSKLAWWALQERIARALETAGARVLWGERLASNPDRHTDPDEDSDLLRLDVGVPGRPTHTLVLFRSGTRPRIRWGAGEAATRWQALVRDPRPTVALVIDDWGNNTLPATRTILGLDIPLTLSILPGRPFSRKFALEATEIVLPRSGKAPAKETAGRAEADRERLRRGCPVVVRVAGKKDTVLPSRRREIILHLPMEPQDYPETDPGPGAVMVGMGPDDINAVLDTDLRGLDGVAGLNNHMGSAATSDEATMRSFMKVLRKRNLYFLDSMTTARSVGYAEARRAGVPALRSRLFLDYDHESPERIRARLDELAASARHSGFVVGIGHPHPATAQVLAAEIPRLQRAGIRFVTLGELRALQEAATGDTP